METLNNRGRKYKCHLNNTDVYKDEEVIKVLVEIFYFVNILWTLVQKIALLVFLRTVAVVLRRQIIALRLYIFCKPLGFRFTVHFSEDVDTYKASRESCIVKIT